MGRSITLSAEIHEHDTASELPQEEQDLLTAASEAANSAYAPYSNFNVGAAVLMDNGETVTGNNQENVAYPSGLCAERVALFAAGAKFPDMPIKAIAITAKSDHVRIDEPLAPCGACRQVMTEYEHRFNIDIKLILKSDEDKVHVVDSVGDILPLSFSSDKLKSK